MADFTFRLTTVLRLREAARDERRMELTETERAERALRRQLEQLHAEWDRLLSTAREAARPGTVAIDRLADAHRYRQTLEARRRQISAQRAELAAEIERRREALLKADRDVRMLERLRDAQQLRHRQETHRREIKSLDETTQLRVAVGGIPSIMNLPSTLNMAASDYHD
jgi:flagellar export protein FliJ